MIGLKWSYLIHGQLTPQFPHMNSKFFFTGIRKPAKITKTYPQETIKENNHKTCKLSTRICPVRDWETPRIEILREKYEKDNSEMNHF